MDKKKEHVNDTNDGVEVTDSGEEEVFMDSGEEKLTEPVLPPSPADIEEELDTKTQSIVEDIVKAKDLDNLRKEAQLFNLNQAKKNAIRILKFNGLLDQIGDQAIERFKKRPNEITNDELLKYLEAVQNSIDRSQKYVNEIEDKPMIQINQQNNDIRIGNTSETILSRESKNKIIDAINLLLKAPLNVSDVIEAGSTIKDNTSEVINTSSIIKENKKDIK